MFMGDLVSESVDPDCYRKLCGWIILTGIGARSTSNDHVRTISKEGRGGRGERGERGDRGERKGRARAVAKALDGGRVKEKKEEKGAVEGCGGTS